MPAGAAQARLFLALWPDAAVRAELAAWRDGWRWPRGAAPVSSARLHLTLHFIGAVERGRIDGLRTALEALPAPSEPWSPFELRFGAAKLWPHGIAVLEPLEVPDALVRLQRALGATLTAAGLAPEERLYKPHVTMARRAAAAVAPASGPPVRWPVTGYALMESTPGDSGGYTVLQHYPFAPHAPD